MSVITEATNAPDIVSEVVSLTSISDNPNDNVSFTITEISDIKTLNDSIDVHPTDAFDAQSLSVKSRITEIETINATPPPKAIQSSIQVVDDDYNDDIIIDEKLSEMSARKSNNLQNANPMVAELVQTPVSSDPYTNENFNHRSIEVAPPIPIKTLGRKAHMESKPEVEAEHINNNPMNIILNDQEYGSMSNQAVMDALRSMATQSLKRAVVKSANEELFAGMVKAKREEDELQNDESNPAPYQGLNIIQPTLTLERQIQVHDELITEKEEQTVVEIKTANISFEVEELDERELKPDLGLPDVFPEVTDPSQFDPSLFDITKLDRTMTMNSQRRLISSESAVKISKIEEETKNIKTGKKAVKPPKMSYRYPGCCVSLLRVFLSLWNTVTLLLGVACIILGIYGQIKFRFGVDTNDTLAIATDPTFIILIIGLIIMVVSFNGAFGFFRGNTIMLKFFGWILVLIFLGLFVGGIVVFAMVGDVKLLIDRTFKHFMTMSSNGHKSAELLIDYSQRTFQCCGSVSKSEYTQKSIGYCDAKQTHEQTCSPPDSCCPAGIVCTMGDAWDAGCIKMLESTFDSNTAMFCGIWVVIWLCMVIQLSAVRHTVHRIGLSRQWHIAYGHIEEEERLKARIAKKEKAMTQIEMDIHVQDMG